jgi:hypothetical protein
MIKSKCSKVVGVVGAFLKKLNFRTMNAKQPIRFLS